MNKVILDFECLRSNESDFIKEAAIVGADRVVSAFFRPPIEWENLNYKGKRTNTWLIRNRLHVHYALASTEMDFSEWISSLFDLDRTVFIVRGLQKVYYLNRFYPQLRVDNCENRTEKYPKWVLENTIRKCPIHRCILRQGFCAQQKAFYLSNILCNEIYNIW